MRFLHKEVESFLSRQIKRKQPKVTQFLCKTKLKQSSVAVVKPSHGENWKGKGPNKKDWFRGETYNVAIRGKRGATSMSTGTDSMHTSITIDGLKQHFDLVVEGGCDGDIAEVVMKLIQDKSVMR